MANAAVTVPPPPRQPRRFGLFSSVPVHEFTDPHQLVGIQWAPNTCTRAQVIPDQCPCPTATEFTPPAPVQDASPFTVLGSWQCALAGFTPDQAQAAAVDNLMTSEQQAVEWALWTGDADYYGPLADDSPQRYHGPRFAHPDTPVLGTVHCATDLFALAESFAVTHYPASPTVHLPVTAMPYVAEGHQVQVASGARGSGSRLETVWGTSIVAGAGYAEANTGPDGSRPANGSYWVYVTGSMQIYRSDILTPPDPASAGFARCNNEFVALAQRIYVAAWDCMTAAILFTPCCACGQPTGVTP